MAMFIDSEIIVCDYSKEMSLTKNAENLPVVLIPGFMLNETLWDDFIAAFPDIRHFIPVSLNEGKTIQDIATNIAQKLPERFVLAGFSLGGYVARAIYEAFPERTAAMILIATSLREDSVEQKRARLAGASTHSSRGFSGMSTMAIKKSLHADFADNTIMIDKIRDMGKRLGATAFRAQSGLNRERITLKPITCPTYVIAAEHDQLRSKEETEELESLTGTCADYVAGCGHLIPLEKPYELAKLISAWLNRKGV
ncbi:MULTISPECIES: alpha/beta fold hydrolase [Klebsiella]|jgi:pimeloyl-ACP methyl ester carboxylesterase|nr:MULTISPECIES: alpha/beta hydrolase [Klebsiella]MCJ3091637.1 alpha/beta hydrolase [Klebsiella quasipneumoniae]MCJ6763175.1 alpha/beta hydrolase [Klebsiella variicola]MCM5818386.1 alpha/beta hydrolase [Klebsiella pneumoniae]MCM6120843.1 alpha/beta hydrolase [Klebsiella pneumoniae]MCM6213197.1 alpha/beta hydrolase [Klebsiella pneumoniae]